MFEERRGFTLLAMTLSLVAVFLSYNANEGLPFVPTRTLYLQLPDGSNLTKGNEVRRGGYRVGFVKSITYRQVGVSTVAVAKMVIAARDGRCVHSSTPMPSGSR